MAEAYKEGQGTLVRRVSFWSLVLLVVWGGQKLYEFLYNRDWGWTKSLLLEDKRPTEGYSIPVLDQRFNWSFVISWAVVIGVCTLIYRFLNRPNSADFLIETDTELKKVTWPSWKDAWNSSVIVIVFVIVLTVFLLVSDYLLNFVFQQVLTRS